MAFRATCPNASRTCARTFNASQADYEIVCVSQDNYDNNLQNTIAAFRANKQPTVTQIFDAGTLDLMLSDAYIPVAPADGTRTATRSTGPTISPASRSYYSTSTGELLSMPFNSSTAQIYYNTDALAKVGFEGIPETWSQVEDVARKMKAAGYDCPVAFDPAGAWQWFEQFEAIHNQPIATLGNGFGGLNAEMVVSKGKFVDQLTWIKKMYDEGLFVHKSKDAGETANDAFVNGKCQITSSSVADHGTFGKQAKEGVHWTNAMLPMLDGFERTNSLVGGASLWTLKGKSAEEYKGAAAFYAFLATPEQAEWWSTVTGYIPVTNTRLRGHEGQGLLRRRPVQGPRTGDRIADRHPADREHPRHPPRQLRLDPRRNGQDHPVGAVQQRAGAAGARRVRCQGQRNPPPLRGDLRRPGACSDLCLTSARTASGRPCILFWWKVPMERRAYYRNGWMPWLLLAPQLLLVLVFFYWPTTQALYWAFSLEQPWGGGNTWVGFDNFLAIFRDREYWTTVLRSAFYAIVTTGLSMVVALTLAAFVDRSLKGTRIFQSIYVWPYAIAAPAAGVAFRFIFAPESGLIGSINEIWPGIWNPAINGFQALMMVIVCHAWLGIGYNFIFFLAALQMIPRSISEAGAMDGARPFQRLHRPAAAADRADGVLPADHEPHLELHRQLRADRRDDRGRPDRADRSHGLQDLFRRVQRPRLLGRRCPVDRPHAARHRPHVRPVQMGRTARPLQLR